MGQSFGTEFMAKYRTKILFAVAVDEIECWLLPIFFTNKSASATNNCLFKLNQQLGSRNEKTINPNNKSVRQYDGLSNDFCKPKKLAAASQKNPSLGLFVENLKSQI